MMTDALKRTSASLIILKDFIFNLIDSSGSKVNHSYIAGGTPDFNHGRQNQFRKYFFLLIN